MYISGRLHLYLLFSVVTLKQAKYENHPRSVVLTLHQRVLLYFSSSGEFWQGFGLRPPAHLRLAEYQDFCCLVTLSYTVLVFSTEWINCWVTAGIN